MRNRFAAWLEQQWVGVGWWHVLLIPLSWIFWLLSAIRRFGYKRGLLKSYRAAVPVIVVGNISIGGTGKTPLVIWLVQQLRKAGFSPGIISRGYGGKHTSSGAVSVDSSVKDVGDEPLLMARRANCPVFVGTDRVAAQQALLQAHPECNVIVSDDGLQHYRMQRDIELAVVDAQRGFGNQWVLPAGPLREGISRLNKVDAVIYNGAEGPASSFVMSLRAGSMQNLLEADKIVDLSALGKETIHAVAGIGNPARFFQQLRNMGLVITEHAFADHYAYQPEDLVFAGDDIILMTEKDAVKCAKFAKANWWYLPVDAVIDKTLADYIVRKLRN